MSTKQNDTYREDIEESLDTAAMVDSEKKDMDIPEAPAVANIKVWIKGYGVMLTVRGEKMMDIVKKTEVLIDYAESHGWKNTWNTTETPIKPVVGQPTNPKVSQEECNHANVGQKKASGFKKPENKGKVYDYCMDCNKFLNWKE